MPRSAPASRLLLPAPTPAPPAIPAPAPRPPTLPTLAPAPFLLPFPAPAQFLLSLPASAPAPPLLSMVRNTARHLDFLVIIILGSVLGQGLQVLR